ncbi:hypothetical protein D9757_007795 [Collybiopsis confluens]|uniref:Uncharacterized protein n=1 Tax=Collybiopsis confluens TaxID=2823264 RepID=A0A8H5MBD3_9AGAR|nr:hypothetical protein D9757_007795 [Collybiopsis confluens]
MSRIGERELEVLLDWSFNGPFLCSHAKMLELSISQVAQIRAGDPDISSQNTDPCLMEDSMLDMGQSRPNCTPLLKALSKERDCPTSVHIQAKGKELSGDNPSEVRYLESRHTPERASWQQRFYDAEREHADNSLAPLTGKERRRERGRLRKKNNRYNRLDQPTMLMAQTPSFDATAFPVSKLKWQGTPFDPEKARQIRTQWFKRSMTSLSQFTRLYFDQEINVPTFVADSCGRIFIARSARPQFIIDNMQKIVDEVQSFVSICTWESRAAREANLRGDHYFCIAGPDRQNKQRPAFRPWGVENKEHVAKFFQEGCIFQKIDDWVKTFIIDNFPNIAWRFRDSNVYWRDWSVQNGVDPPIQAEYGGGHFFNWCLNAPKHGSSVVRCAPHVDSKNLAFAVCVIFIYGFFNHNERLWLVVWEARLIIQLPAGILLAYPSAIFYHYNIDLADIEIVVTANGEPPTPENSKPVYQEGQEEIRGSMVWFNQATMFSSSELNIQTLKSVQEADKARFAAAKEQGLPPPVPTNLAYNYVKALEQGIFPSAFRL